MASIHKSELKGKYIRFIKDGKFYTQRVVKISGNTLTVMNKLKVRSRIHKDKVLGQEMRKKGLRPIDWSIRRQ
jgi:hypothetical protein